MLYCEKCKVTLTGAPSFCPLCQGDLGGSPEKESAFPDIPFYARPHQLFLRFAALGTIAAAAICIAVNLSLPKSGWWSAFVVAGLACGWLTFAVIIKKRGNIPKAILWQVGLVSALAYAWDRWTGMIGWSLDYVMPILCTCAMIAMSVIARIIRLRIQDYILYLVLDILFGLVPLILLLHGMLHVVYPSAVCIAASVIFLAALLLFEGTAFKDELIRRLHL